MKNYAPSLCRAALALFAGTLAASAWTYRPGLLQGKSNANNAWDFALANSAIPVERVPGPVMADVYAAESSYDNPANSYVNEATGSVYHWNQRDTTFTYQGEIYLEAGTTIVFGKHLDDAARIVLDGDTILNDGTWNAFATGSYTADTTGWYPIDIRIADGAGGKGPPDGGINRTGLGLAYNTTGATSESGGDWAKLADPGDMSFFRVPVDESLSLLRGATYAGGTYTFTLAIPGGSGSARVYLGVSGSTAATEADLADWAASSETVAIPAGGTATATVAWAGPGDPIVVVHAKGADADGGFETLTDPLALDGPKAEVLGVSIPVLDEAAVNGAILFCGGAATCDITFTYGPADAPLPAGATLSGRSTGGFSFPMPDLAWNTDYRYRVTVSNGVDPDAVTEGTFTTPHEDDYNPMGLYQGRYSCPGAGQPPDFTIRIADIDPAYVDRTLGMLMARASSDSVTSASCTDALTAQFWGWTQDNLCFLYEGSIWLEKDVPFYVVSKFDDGGAVYIDDVEVFNQWTKSGGSGYNDQGSYTAGVYTPSTTGWHAFRGYIWDWTGGKNRMWGVAGVQWSTSPNAVTVSGSTVTAVRDNVNNPDYWHEFYDAGNGKFLTLSGVADLVVETAVMDGDTLVATVAVPNIGPATLYAWHGETYGGIDDAQWDAKANLGAVAGDGTESRVATVPVGPDSKYIRFVAVPDDASALPSVSRTLCRSQLAEAAAAPNVALSAATGIGYDAATVPVQILYAGVGAASCSVDLVYGPAADALVYTNQLAAGLAAGVSTNLTLSGLLPDRQYFVAALATSDQGETGLSDTITFTTASLNDGGEAAQESLPGLWQSFTRVTRDRSVNPATADGAEVIPAGAVMVCAGDRGESPFSSYTSPSGNVYGYGEHITYAYSGYMFMKGGVPYSFAENYDDWGRVIVNGTTFFDNSAWDSTLFATYTPETDGWYPVDFRVSNDGSGGGPHVGAFTKDYLGAGIAFSTNETTLTTANYMNWQAPTNTADAIIFRTAPYIRPLVAGFPSVANGVLTVDLETVADMAANDLYVCYGATFGGDDTNGWEHVDFLGALAPDATGYTSAGDVTGIYAGVRYVRYCLDCTYLGWSWSKTLVFGDADAPHLATATVVTGLERGDAATVSGTLESPGGGVCTVTLEISRSADLADAAIWPVATTNAPCDFSVDVYSADPASPYYIAPGVVHYYRFRAVNEAGLPDLTPIRTFTPKAGVKLDSSSLTATASMWNITVTGKFTDFGAGDTTLWLYTGMDPNDLSPAATQTLSSGDMGYTFATLTPEVEKPFYYAVLASNACSTVWWTDWSTTKSITCPDSAKYYWKGDVQSGYWNDPDCWDTDPDDPRLLYPNATEAWVYFSRCTSGEPYTVAVSGEYYVKVLEVNAQNADVTFLGGGTNVSRILTAFPMWDGQGLRMTTGNTVTFDGVFFQTQGQYFTPANSTLRLDNAAFFQAGREIELRDTGSRIEVHEDSVLRVADYSFRQYGIDTRLVLDNSTLEVSRGSAMLSWKEGAVSNVVEFIGSHPKLVSRGIVVGEETVGDPATLLFHVPVGGYAEAPIQQQKSDNNIIQRTDKQDLIVTVAKDSEWFSGSANGSVQLISWPTGILASRVQTGNQPSADHTRVFWTYGATQGDPTATEPDGSNPTGLWAELHGLGATVIILR